jgi:disulfide oxidoreductase YuzD
MQLTVYGADTPCPSCVHSPSSIETMEWLEAAIKRRFPKAELMVRYVDLDFPETEEDHSFTQKIKNDDYFYPLIVAEGQVLGEGDPRLKPIFEFLESKGFAE